MTRHLLHIGFPKTGSTLLQQWFAAHPQLAFADGGIAGFYDVYGIVRSGVHPRGDVRYHVTSSEGLSAPNPEAGGGSVEYLDRHRANMPASQAAICATLSAIFGGSLVLIVTRGFRAMILSSYSQYVRSGGNVPFDELIAPPRAGRSADVEHLATLGPWDYDRVIGLYAAAFGAANIIVMPYELLRDDAHAFFATLAARLDIDHIHAATERVNPSLSPVEMFWYPRLARTAQRMRSARLFRFYARLAFTNRLRVPIRVLQRLRPGTPVSANAIPDAVLDSFRGRAESLRGNPLYAPYASDYLLGQ
jgi:hypothetical protein